MSTTDRDDLIPVRALNQVSYCPRLYYLEYVESVMPTNEYVEDGLFQHRRVNDPRPGQPHPQGGRRPPHPERLAQLRAARDHRQARPDGGAGRRRPARSSTSARPRRPATTADRPPGRTTPSSSAPRGCSSRRSSARRSRRASSTTSARRRASTSRSTRRCGPRRWPPSRLIRELSARDAPPEPLPDELRHRCYGCSLATVCLPEETLYATRHPEPAAAPARPRPLARVVPQSDDGAVLYLNEPGSHVGKRSEHLVVRRDGAGGQPGADRLDPPGRRLRQRPGLDPGPGVPGDARSARRLPDPLRPVRRRLDARPGQERQPACRPVPRLRRPGPRAGTGQGGRPGEGRQPADAPDALPPDAASRRRPRHAPSRRAAATSRPPATWPTCWPGSTGSATSASLLGTRRPGRLALLRRVRPDAQGPGPGPPVRLPLAEPPAARATPSTRCSRSPTRSWPRTASRPPAPSASTPTAASSTPAATAARRWPST